MLVFDPVSIIHNKDLKEKSCEQSEIGKNSYVGVLHYDKILTVKQGKNHWNGNRSSIIGGMK